LAAPEMLVLMGNTACKALLGRTGITRMRGTWTQAAGRPALPMFHPAAVLRDPIKKRDCWADLLTLQDRLRA
ncbi:MAG: uracil-DNA glycosylase family protein, partial [Pseudomonadota bacterium]